MIQTKASLAEDISAFKDALPGGAISFYGKVDDVNAVYNQIKNKVEIVKDLETSWYGMREFYIRDINGYILGFASQDPNCSILA